MWEVNIPPAPSPSPSPAIGLKRHTFNIKHHLHKSLYINSFFEKFIEELGFVELSAQAKHLTSEGMEITRRLTK